MKKFKDLMRSEFINGQTTFDWIFLGIGILLQIVAIAYGYATGNPDNIWCIISGLTGIISVVLCAQGKISFYVFGYIQLLTYVFAVAIPFRLWGEVFENIFYFVTMVIGMVIWFKNYRRNEDGSATVESKKLGKLGWVVSILILIVSTVGLALVLKNVHIIFPILGADPTPWLDSITTTAPFIAQIFLMLGYRDQWAFWIIEDIISMVMFIVLGNWIMVAQYLFWTINCIYGWIKWSQSERSICCES